MFENDDFTKYSRLLKEILNMVKSIYYYVFFFFLVLVVFYWFDRFRDTFNIFSTRYNWNSQVKPLFQSSSRPALDIHKQSLEWAFEYKDKDHVRSDISTLLQRPLVSITFGGSRGATTFEGNEFLIDNGTHYQSKVHHLKSNTHSSSSSNSSSFSSSFSPQNSNVYSWGWNCDLHANEDARVRTTGKVDFLKFLVVPNRHNGCGFAPVWRLSLPAGHYTVRFSATDPENLYQDSGGCKIQGYRIGDLLVQNSCGTETDPACVVLRDITVQPTEQWLELEADYQDGCFSVNYIQIFAFDKDTALALSTFQAPKMNIVDPDLKQQETYLDQFLAQLANDHGDIIAASVNAGYISFAMNWLCSISTMDIENYFLIATDDESYTYFHERGYPVYHVKKTREGEGQTDAVEYGTVEYQELILQRTKLVNKVLHLGYNILLCDVDAVWLQNPVRFLSHGFDMQSQPEADGRVCGGFMFMLSTLKMQQLWQTVTDRHELMVQEAENNHGLESIDQSEQELLLELLPLTDVTVKRLDSDMFPYGQKYFGKELEYTSQMDLKHVHPVVVHNNYVIGKQKKLMRFQHFGLWFIGDSTEDYVCHISENHHL
jgi:hypothetical protein